MALGEKTNKVIYSVITNLLPEQTKLKQTPSSAVFRRLLSDWRWPRDSVGIFLVQVFLGDESTEATFSHFARALVTLLLSSNPAPSGNVFQCRHSLFIVSSCCSLIGLSFSIDGLAQYMVASTVSFGCKIPLAEPFLKRKTPFESKPPKTLVDKNNPGLLSKLAQAQYTSTRYFSSDSDRNFCKRFCGNHCGKPYPWTPFHLPKKPLQTQWHQCSQ